MARIRTIKPEFPQSETIGALSRDARLLFVQLWTMADDHGRAKAAPRLLASLLYPYDTDAVELMPMWLDELQEKGCIRLYQVEGNSYLDIPNWGKHQRVDNAGKSHIPEHPEMEPVCEEVRREPPRAAASVGGSPLDLGPSTKDLGPRTGTARAGKPAANDDWEEFKRVYPKRKGGNPWEPARKLFDGHVRKGADPKRIVAAVKAGVGYDKDKIDTEYIPQAQVWLRQKRYEDYLNGTEADNGRRAIAAETIAFMASKGYVPDGTGWKLAEAPPDTPGPEPGISASVSNMIGRALKRA